MEKRRCEGCNGHFLPQPQIPNQSYCSAPSCQRERRRRWQQAKRRDDVDYHANQAQAQQAWNKRHGDYWREYRAQHPEYRERNRQQQQQRDQRRSTRDLAKMDVSMSDSLVASGTYQLARVGDDPLAKMDVCMVEITLLSRA